MLALRWSFAKDLFLVALLGATTLVAAARDDGERAASPITDRRIDHSVRVRLVRHQVHQASELQRRAEASYRDHSFRTASELMKLAAEDDPDLTAEAQLYAQFDRAWGPVNNLSYTAIQQFEGLRYARRLDVSLGGLWGDEIDGRLKKAAPLAADQYRSAGNEDGLKIATATCEALGVRPMSAP